MAASSTASIVISPEIARALFWMAVFRSSCSAFCSRRQAGADSRRSMLRAAHNTVMPTIPNRESTPSGSSRGVPSCSRTTRNAKQRTPAMTGRINSVRLCMVPLISYIRR